MLLIKAKSKLRWVAVSFALVVVVLTILKFSSQRQCSAFVNAEVQSSTQQELQEEKLSQEIEKLRLENEKLRSFWGILVSFAPFLTGLVALAGILVAVWKQITERSRQQDLDRQQREYESLRRLDEKFTSTVEGLGAESEAIQASAAVSIQTFLKPEYKALHNQVFMILFANLKIKHSDAINRLLIAGFEKAIRLELPSLREKDEEFELDLSRCNLNRIDLSGLDLSQTDLAFAQLRDAKLTDANLRRARGMEANLEKARLSRAVLNEARFRKAHFKGTQFHEANLVAADLEETDLRDAQFQQAKMQSAHLDNADLSGARFEQANISDAFFKGAILNEKTLRSILRAFNWQKAHFDEKPRAKLKQLAENSG
jgi:uncharacterized protein YjbI with pentapeptide repeats